MASKLVVFSFGRLNPPTIGHEKLANAVKLAAQKLGGEPRMYLSHTQDKKKNPLPYELKLKYAQAAFGPLVTASDANTIIKILAELNKQFTDMVFIAGSDRVAEFEKLFNDYNGKGEYDFRTIRVISAGERDPDSDGVEGMSASKMREAAAANDVKSFTGGLPAKLKPAAATIIKAVRMGMGLTEAVEPHPAGYQKDILTTPKYTLVIDTPSDLDWYKIGQHFPNLGTEDPDEYGQSDTDMTIALANQEEMDKLKAKLDRLGLKYKEIGGTLDQPEIHSEASGEADWDWSSLAAKFKRWLITATADGRTKNHHIRAGSLEMAKQKFARMFPSAKIVSVVQEDAAPGDINEIISEFVSSPTGQKYAKYDCKSVTRAFVQWAEANKIPVQVLSLAPPSAETIKQRPNLRGKSGNGDGHIMPVVNGQAIDFTVRQFGVNRPYENPLITPISQVKQVYNKIGGYFTDDPEWFLGGKTHYLGPWKAMPASIMNMEFGDEILGEAKITLYTDPDYYGADVDDSAGAGLPVKDIPLAKLVGFEPDEKMKDAKSAANMGKMVELIKSGKGGELPPILVRKYKGGYQVLDGHHRFHAYQAAGAKIIPGKIVPDSDIEVKSKGPKEITTESKKASKAEAGYQAEPKGGQRCVNCTMWRDPHWCTAVAGEISPDGWCEWFAAGAPGKHGKLDESMKPTGINMGDGDLYISDHFMSRAAQRGLDGRRIANMIYDAIKDHGAEIKSMEPSNFVIRGRDRTGIGIGKIQQPDDSFKYVLYTAHPKMRVGPTQSVLMVESDDLNIKIHQDLNPAIWAKGKMRPEVRNKLLAIAEDFKASLGVDVEIRDITVSGSNAAYSYTDKSDIDLHLVVDIPKADGDPLYRELFDAKKFKYNAEHDYKIRGYDVELYVQDANQKHISLGIYSIKDDAWIKAPKHVERVDSTGARYKYDQLKGLIQRATRLKDQQLALRLRDTIKKYRQVGLAAHGEFGAENLAFKALRTNGLIKDLYDSINDTQDAELSIEHTEIIDEVRMNPKALAAFAQSDFAKNITMGFEAEIIVPGLSDEDDRPTDEPDWDMDERVETSSWNALSADIIRFFRDTNGRNYIERQLEKANEYMMEYMEEQFSVTTADDKNFLRNIYKGNTELSDDEIDASIEAEDSTHSDMLEKARDEFYESWDDIEGWLESADLTMMSDWSRDWDLDWPHYLLAGEVGQEGREELAASWQVASGYFTVASDSYHGEPRRPKTWIFEPDSSIQGNDGEGGVEVISPPMRFDEGMNALDTFWEWAEKKGAYSNRSTGFHMGVSMPGHSSANIDHLKLVLFLGDDYVLQQFGRSANSYAKSTIGRVKDMIKADKVPALLANIRDGMNKLAQQTVSQSLLPRGDRFVSVNIKNEYIEFRSAGGKYLNEEGKEKITNTLFRYIRALSIAADPEAEKQEYAKKLYKLVAKGMEDVSNNTLQLFTLYSAGVLNKSDLVQKLKAAQAARRGEIPQPTGKFKYELKDPNTDEILGTFYADNDVEALKYGEKVKRKLNKSDITVRAVVDGAPSEPRSVKYEIFDRDTGDALRDIWVRYEGDWVRADDQAVAILNNLRTSFGGRNVSVRRATTNLNDSKSALTGAEMLEYYDACHHSKMKNSKMESYVKSHDWQLSQISPDELPNADEYKDDAFGRKMKLDLDRVKEYMEALRKGERIDPIIMGPRKSVIDGNHRAQAARKLGRMIECYKPVIVESTEKRKMDLMLGGHLVD